MTTKEAIQAMLDGKKVKGDLFSAELYKYIFFDGEYFRNEHDDPIDLNKFVSTKWELYKEPKKKEVVVIEKWLVQSSIDHKHIIMEVESASSCSPFIKVKLLEAYEVEL